MDQKGTLEGRLEQVRNKATVFALAEGASTPDAFDAASDAVLSALRLSRADVGAGEDMLVVVGLAAAKEYLQALRRHYRRECCVDPRWLAGRVPTTVMGATAACSER